jgi:CRISPR-associated protein Csm5
MVEAFLQTAHCTISTLTPVHMGCGEGYYPTNYVIKNQRLYHFNENGLIKGLSSIDIKELVRISEQRGENSPTVLQAFIFDKADKLIPYATHSVVVTAEIEAFYLTRIGRSTEKTNLKEDNKTNLEIQRHAFNPYSQQALVSGSGIKGSIRTAVLDQLNNKNYKKIHRPNPGLIGREGKALQKKLLNYKKVQEDPFRLLKISDALYEHPNQLNGLEIRFGVNRMRTEKKDMKGKGIPIRMECLAANRQRCFKFDISFLKDANIKIPKLNDVKSLARICNDYYVPILQQELALISELKFANPTWIQFVEKLLDGELGHAIKQDKVFLLRLGKQAGAESKTIEGVRHIKIGHGQDAEYWDHTTTIWFAADSLKQARDLLPFGWVIVEVGQLDLTETMAFFESNCQKDYLVHNAYQEQLHEIERVLMAQQEQEKAWAVQELQKKTALEEEQRQLESMTSEQALIFSLRRDFKATFNKNVNQPQGELRQQLTAAIKQAIEWNPEERKQLLALAREMVDYWGLKKNKKIKAQLKTLVDE